MGWVSRPRPRTLASVQSKDSYAACQEDGRHRSPGTAIFQRRPANSASPSETAESLSQIASQATSASIQSTACDFPERKLLSFARRHPIERCLRIGMSRRQPPVTPNTRNRGDVRTTVPVVHQQLRSFIAGRPLSRSRLLGRINRDRSAFRQSGRGDLHRQLVEVRRSSIPILCQHRVGSIRQNRISLS